MGLKRRGPKIRAGYSVATFRCQRWDLTLRGRAMVYVAYQCGGLCGGGTLYLLEKVNGGWREAAKLCMLRA